MRTCVEKCGSAAFERAAKLVRAGEVVGFPTETVYGLGANALNPEAVMKIFAAKGRPADNPLIVHITDISQVNMLIEGEMPECARMLAKKFWPGPLTMIMRKSELIPDCVSAGLATVGVRMPVMDDMDGRIPMILDGGECSVGLESTVLDVTGDVPRVLRPGGVTPEMIAETVGGCIIDETVMRPLKEGERPISPGTKYRHYAPKGSLTIFDGEPGEVARAICEAYDEAGDGALILALEEHLPLYGERRVISLGADAEEMAHRLFDELRSADDIGAGAIFSEAVPGKGIGLAVMNRLGRAAAFHIEKI